MIRRFYEKWRPILAHILGAILLVSLFPLAITYLVQTDNRDYHAITGTPGPVLERQMEDFYRVIRSKPGATVMEYFNTVEWGKRLEMQAQKFRAEHGNELATNPRLFLIRGFMSSEASLLIEPYQQKFGGEEFRAAAVMAQPMFAAEQARDYVPERKGAVELTMAVLKWTCILSVLVAVAFLVVRVKDEGMRLAYELCHPYFYLAVLFWPVGVFRYPRYINPVTQAKRALRFIGGVVGAAVSVTTLAGVAAAGESKTESGGSDGSNEFVLRAIPMPTATVLTVGIEDNKILSNGVLGHPGAVSTYDVNVSFKALSFGLSGTHALAGSSGSDEVDYGVALVGKPFRQWAPTATVAASMYYYDIAPEGTSKGGDILAPSISVSQPIGRGFTASVEVDGDLTRNTPSGLNGIAVLATVGCSTNVGHVRLDHSLQAIYANGPFGHDAGLLGRFEERASLPLTRHTTLNAFFRAFGSLIGARDRGGSHVTVGLGLSQAF